MIKHLINVLRHRVNVAILNIIFATKELRKNKVYIQYSVFGKNLTLDNRNFGDDINKVLIEELFHKTVIPFRFSIIGRLLKCHKFMCIGSVITMFDLSNTTIWGTGVLSSNFSVKGKPLKVCAVRGPLSRQYLLGKGIDCPNVFGDPALLLPRIYNPEIKVTHRIGVIAHYLDHNQPVLANFLKRYSSEILFIDIVNYGNWKQFIDKVLSCDFIISSSLHGLIVSDAYGVPNYWCKIHFEMDDNGFKFRDYFLSVNKKPYVPFKLCDNTTIEEVQDLKKQWTPIDIDLDSLVQNSPFKSL